MVVVAHLQQKLKRRHFGTDALHVLRQRAVEDQCLGGGVVQQIQQLLVHVAVVDVERRQPRLERAEHAFQVLVAVVEIEAQVVLARLEVLERVATRVAAVAPHRKEMRETIRALLKLPIGQAPVAKDDGVAVGNGVGNGVEYGSQIEVHASSFRETLPAPKRPQLPCLLRAGRAPCEPGTRFQDANPGEGETYHDSPCRHGPHGLAGLSLRRIASPETPPR